MAFGEHLIDFVNRLPAVAGRTAGPERRPELRTLRVLPPHPPAGETPGLARQIFERQLEGLKPPSEALGIDEAIGRRSGISQRAQAPATGLPPRDRWRRNGCAGDCRADVLRCWRVRSFSADRRAERRDADVPAALPDGPAGIGREDGASFTTRPRAAMTIRRRSAASAGRRTRSTARWRGCGSRPAVTSPASPSMAKRA